MADYWLARKEYQKAGTYFGKVYNQLKNTGEGNLLVLSLIGLGKTFIAKGDLKQGLSFAYEALDLAKQRDSRVTLRDAYHLLYTIFDTLGRADSAYTFYKKYVEEKEAVISDQFKGKLFAYKQVSEIRMLKNEKLLAEQKLEGNRLLRNILIGGIAMLLFFGMVIFLEFFVEEKERTAAQ